MAAPLSENEIRQITLNGANLVPRQIDQHILQEEITRYERASIPSLLPSLFVSRSMVLKLTRQRVSNLFHQVFSTLRTDITNQHRTAACNLLSNLIEKCAQSGEQLFVLALWQNERFWYHAFWIYLDQHHALNVKPSRLLLTSLTSALLKCQDKSVCDPEKARLLELLVQHIATPSENAPTRPAMQALAHWLSKNVVSVNDICSVFDDGLIEKKGRPVPASIQDVLNVVLHLAPYEDFASSAGSLAALLIQKAGITSQTPSSLAFDNHHASLWSHTILDILRQKPKSLEIFRLYVFPEIFQQDRPSFNAFLGQLGIQSILGGDQPLESSLPLPTLQCEEVLFCALSVGSKLGLVKIADASSVKSVELFLEKEVLCIPDVLLGNLLLRTSDAVRVAGLAMLTTSTTTTQPLSFGAMSALQRGLPFLHADADAGLRSELFSFIRHLMERIKAATATLSKPPSKTKKNKAKEILDSSSTSIDVSELITAHKSFIEWYVSFLKAELRPTASYQRHISALRCISIIVRSGVDARVSGSLHAKSSSAAVAWPFTLDVIDHQMTGLLIDLLLNAFDDVRSAAAEIMSLVDLGSHQKIVAGQTPMAVQILAQAEKRLVLSGRADHADGVAHLYSILFSQCSDLTSDRGQWWASKCGILEHLLHTVEQTIEIANADISKAVSNHPLHGLFISLRYHDHPTSALLNANIAQIHNREFRLLPVDVLESCRLVSPIKVLHATLCYI